jgi:hypothetical protein
MPNGMWPAISTSWSGFANATTSSLELQEFTCGSSNFFANGTFKSGAISKLVSD